MTKRRDRDRVEPVAVKLMIEEATMNKVQTKYCCACKQDKPVDEFHACRGRPDGRQTRCKRCKIRDNLNYASRNRPQMQANCKRHYYKDVAKTRKSRRRHRRLNHATYLASERRWKADNRDKVLAAVHRRRARIAGVGGSFTVKQWLDKLKRYGSRCAYCSCAGKMTKHHVIPISRGGPNTIRNIVPACLGCNLSIGVKIVKPRKQGQGRPR